MFRRLNTLYPGRPLLLGLTGLALLALLAWAWPWFALVWQIGALLLTAFALADLLLLRGQPMPLVQRRLPPNLSIGSPQRVILGLRNPGRQRLRMRLHDHHPEGFEAQGMPVSLSLDGSARAQVTYRVVPRARGRHHFCSCGLVLHSPMGLWQRLRMLDNPETVKVFPNFAATVRFSLLARRNRLSNAGVRRRQRRGQGADFHQLRDYQQGDSLRQIDWKATGRYRRLIAREFQDDQNQRLFFLLDCGQRMRHQDAEGNHLDSALDAMLLAAHAAVHQGDAVGYMTFAGSERFFPPRAGSHSLPALLRSAYDIESTTRAADYLRMSEQFMAHGLRRSLVVLISNSRDGDQADLLLAVRLLQTRHLVIVADMRESLFERLTDEAVEDQPAALRFHATMAMRESRRQAHDSLRHQGAVVVDILPSQLPLALVNTYYEIKRAGRL